MVTGTDNVLPSMANNMQSPTSTSPSEVASSTRRISDNRRSNKPIMEKRRRARINNCLNELKTLILDAMKKDPARHSKLEKADILEMTVKHLQNLQRQQVAMSAATDPLVLNKFRAGFKECASEVDRYAGIDPSVKRLLLQHLTNCLNQGNKPQEVPQQLQVHILPNNTRTTEHMPQNSSIMLSNGNTVQLVSARLSNGELAFLLPNPAATPQQQQRTSPVPLLVPITPPERTSSTTSASSSGTNYSPSHSPDLMDVMYHNQPKPLSLVVRKQVEPMELMVKRPMEPMEEKPWRPW